MPKWGGDDEGPAPRAQPARRKPLRMPEAWVARVVSDAGQEAEPRDDDALDDGEEPSSAVALPRPSHDDADAAHRDQRQHVAAQTWQQWRKTLRRHLDPSADAPWRQPIYWRAAVERVARGASLWPLPRRRVQRWPGHLVLALDVSPSMRPFLADMEDAVTRLQRSLGPRSVLVCELGAAAPDQAPQPWWQNAKGLAVPASWKANHVGVMLVLSDLGAPPRQPERRDALASWMSARQRQNTHVAVMLPDPAAAPADLPASARCVAWGQPDRLRRPRGAQQPSSSLEAPLRDVLALLALCGTVTAPLLRALVRQVAAGPHEAAVLWWAWNHRDTEWVGGNGDYVRLRTDGASVHEAHLKAMAADTVHHAHQLRAMFGACLADTDEHMAVLRACVLAPQLAQPLRAQARAAAVHLEHDLPNRLKQAQGEERALMAAGVAAGVVAAAHPRVRTTHASTMRSLLALAHEPALRRGEVLSVLPEIGALAITDVEPPSQVRWRHWCLVQQGQQLLLAETSVEELETDDKGRALHVMFAPAAEHGVRLLEHVGPAAEHEGMRVVVGGQSRWLPVKDQKTVALLDLSRAEGAVTVHVGEHRAELHREPRPSWASAFSTGAKGVRSRIVTPWGEIDAPQPGQVRLAGLSVVGVDGISATCGVDNFGCYMDLELLASSRQRFRWIEPGRFDMGSHESEREGLDPKLTVLWDSESPRHEVELTEGYWLADTPCTQGLWQAVMSGENPSHFGDEADATNRPVEQVGWDDVQGFVEALKKLLPEGSQPCLPSEAQWEYASRAGTQSAYWWGDDADSAKANWDGEQRGTTAVKRYEPNAWGLYDMHGNVWEWCAGGRRKYTQAAAVDPPDDASEEALRVLRGGSWDYPPGLARSACRYAGLRDSRLYLAGFRLALRSTSPGGGAASKVLAGGAGNRSSGGAGRKKTLLERLPSFLRKKR